MGQDSGCMVGNPGLIVMGDAYIKGIRGFDIKKAYERAVRLRHMVEEYKSL